MKRGMIFGIVFLVLVSSVYSVYSYGLGISPTEINFEGNAGERICRNVDIFSKDYLGQIDVKDKWAKGGAGKNADKYTLTRQELGIGLSYNERFNLENQSTQEICLASEGEGSFNGLLLFSAADSNIEVGVWINAYLGGKKSNWKNWLTGFSIKNINLPNASFNLSTGEIGTEKILIGQSLLTTLILFVVLIYIVRVGNKRKREEMDKLSSKKFKIVRNKRLY